MNQDVLKDLLQGVSRGEITVEESLERLKNLPFEDLGFACIDHHRTLRKGLSEVIFGEGKDVSAIEGIMDKMLAQEENVLVTRLSRKKAVEIQAHFPDSTFHERARMLTVIRRPIEVRGRGAIVVMTAGTSDIPVGEEAAVVARFMGNRVETIYDVGVAGLHRLLGHWEKITGAAVIVVAAGMEGALPSVVGGLVDKPVIAVPTSVGYGAGFGGIAALLGMLNSCAAGVTVVNIDNGFGAGYAAAVINRA
ncbi:MAG: nickel pincer cofactor biosynthesis protein LarB [Deltaproteobacteria bacterium]|nr:nickel pincer cofactor biosynthesis protein LarB [Deltaproteobacteria bacterium]MBW2112816.1 nickel pincer cofactor biosynthesis protein LarB [Deltaproteobacteria bacterium]HDZ91229.1 nickel pincer cofactor biosynthesis protein LarB [Deltaproteobacteria bacterium]